MTLEEVYQSEANLTYAIKMNFPELMTKEDVQNLIDYLNHESIPKEKVREKIEQLTENDNLVVNEKWDSVDVVCAKREEMAQVDILQELLGE